MQSKESALVGLEDTWFKDAEGSPLSPEQSWLKDNIAKLENGPKIGIKYNAVGKTNEEEEAAEDGSLDIVHVIGLLIKDKGFPPFPSDFLKNSADCKLKSYKLIDMTRIDNFGDFSYPQLGVELGGSTEEKGLGLIHMLLAAADLIGTQRYDAALQMVLRCKKLSTPFGNSVERIGYYFTEALEEKIELDTRGSINTLNVTENSPNIEAKVKEVEMATLLWYQSLPFSKVAHFTANQAILEAVVNAQKIHIIDFDIKEGLQWPNLMQSMALRKSGPPQTLKITAVSQQKRPQKMTKTGKQLSNFAKSLNISFSFRTATINKVNTISSDMSELDPTEVIVVNASIILQGLFQEPGGLRSIVDFITSLRPLIFTVIHNEGRHNSTVFVNRFTEVLFYYSAIFDSLDGVLEQWDLNRVKIERFLIAPGIINMVAHEGKERVIRHVEAEVWDSFMKQAGYRGIVFSEYAKYQAKLMVRDFKSGCEGFCIDAKGLALVVGWNSTPILSISAWTPKTL